MANTLTLTGQANVDQASGTVDVDLRQNSVGGGIITATAQITIRALAAPPAPTAAIVTVASAPGGARYVKITYIGQNGETVASPETFAGTATAGQGVQITSPPALTGATQWRPYISATSGGETQQGAAINIGTNYTETSAGITTTGAAAPTTDTTGWNAGSCTVTITQP
jgi:hypothetical protein